MGLVANGLRFNTHRTYSAAQKQYIQFCETYKLVPLPATEELLLRYIAYMYSRPGKKSKSLTHNTMQVYLSSVRSLHVMHGFPPPPTSSPRVSLALKAVAASSPLPVQKSPITYDLLCSLLAKLSLGFDDLVWRAALLMGLTMCLRGSEYTEVYQMNTQLVVIKPPVVSQITFDTLQGISYMCYTVPVSKTTLHPFKKYAACNHSPNCAVCMMRRYLQARARLGTALPHLPLLQFKNGQILSKHMLDGKIKQLVTLVGLDPSSYSSHSLRSGVVCMGHRLGLSDRDLASLGNWRSDAFKTYIRDSGIHQLQLSKKLFHI